MEESSNCSSSFFQWNEFLKDSGKELHSHASISEKNCRAIKSHTQEILSNITNTVEFPFKTDLFHDFLNIKMENVKSKYSNHEQTLQMNSLVGAIQKKKKTVENMEKELKDLEIKYENLKKEIEHEEQEDRSSAELFHKAVKYFTTYFQYIIEEVHGNENNYIIKIDFVIEGKLSKYPIHFIFDTTIDTLISLHVGELLTARQQEILLQRFKETNNLLALFSTLRHSVLLKRASVQK